MLTMPDVPEDRLLRTGQVAQMFGVSTRTVRRWLSEGILVAEFVTPRGKHRRYRESAVAKMRLGKDQTD